MFTIKKVSNNYLNIEFNRDNVTFDFGLCDIEELRDILWELQSAEEDIRNFIGDKN